MSDFVEAVVRATGRKQTIPAHWLSHPTIGDKFRLTKRKQREQEPEPVPVEQEPEPVEG